MMAQGAGKNCGNNNNDISGHYRVAMDGQLA